MSRKCHVGSVRVDSLIEGGRRGCVDLPTCGGKPNIKDRCTNRQGECVTRPPRALDPGIEQVEPPEVSQVVSYSVVVDDSFLLSFPPFFSPRTVKKISTQQVIPSVTDVHR